MKLAKSSQSRAPTAQTESHGAILETGYNRKAAISDRDYAFIRELVYRETRINLGSNKRELVAARLGKRLRMLGISSFNAYCSLLKDRSSGEELYHLIDAISTNHTFFFREANHFNFLNSSILPAFERGEIGDSRSMRLWSCACSTGEEPYSVAISLAERFGVNSPASWHMECTDISTRVLRFASKAVYTEAHLQQVNPKTRKRYFQTGRGANAGSFRIRPELRNHLSFSRLNLFESALPWKEKFHCIWCRNVMIYFDRKTQDGLVVKVGDDRFILPTTSVKVALRPDEDTLAKIQGAQEILNIRGKVFPLFRLHNHFKIPNAETDPKAGTVVIVENGGKQCGLLVDGMVSKQEVVIKSLGSMMQGIPGVSGGAILGDGNIALILDTASLISAA